MLNVLSRWLTLKFPNLLTSGLLDLELGDEDPEVLERLLSLYLDLALDLSDDRLLGDGECRLLGDGELLELLDDLRLVLDLLAGMAVRCICILLLFSSQIAAR